MLPHGVCTLTQDRLKAYLTLPDLTDPANGHAIALLLDRLAQAASRWSGLAADVIRTDPIVTATDNFDRLFYDPDAVARSARYTHRVDEMRILRTHMTAAIPALLAETRRERLILCPGLVFRRDVVDRHHVGAPHQVDLWLLRRGRLGRAELLHCLACLMEAVLPGRNWHVEPALHPYTVNGLQVDIETRDGFVELLECGEIHPWLLEESGLPCLAWSGLALGIGLDRLAMAVKGIDDIRLLRSNDPRIERQMGDLAPYRPVSHQPPARRDLSLAVTDDDLELIGDRIRAGLGPEAEWVEAVEALAVHSYEALPQAARERLGMRPGQRNLLLRVVLRRPDGTIPRAEGNRLYAAIYALLHEGSRGYGPVAGTPDA